MTWSLQDAADYLNAGSGGESNFWNNKAVNYTSNQGAGADMWAPFGGSQTLQALHNAVNGGHPDHAAAILKKLRASQYGIYGTPYGAKLPGKLDDVMQKLIKHPRSGIDGMISDMEALANEGPAQGSDAMYQKLKPILKHFNWNGLYMANQVWKDSGWSNSTLEKESWDGPILMGIKPGVFQWQGGWENDPEWKAWSETRTSQRRQAAQGRQERARGDQSMPTLGSSGQYSQLQSLFGAHGKPGAPGGGRPGQTEATRPGAVPYVGTPGQIGLQAAEHTAPEPDEYEY